MQLNDIVSVATRGLHGALAKLQRDSILWAACAFCAVAAIVMATSASILALEPLVGSVYARLIVAGVFALIVVVIVLSVRLARPPQHARPAVTVDAHIEAAPRNVQFAQIAMIIEAVMLGYSLSRKDRR